MSEPGFPPRLPLPLERLSDRQMVIVHWLAHGRSLASLAASNGQNRSTLVTQLKRALKRLGAKNHREMVIRYWRDTQIRIVTADEISHERRTREAQEETCQAEAETRSAEETADS